MSRDQVTAIISPTPCVTLRTNKAVFVPQAVIKQLTDKIRPYVLYMRVVSVFLLLVDLRRIITPSGQLPRMPIIDWRVPISWVIYDVKDGNGVKWQHTFVMTESDNWPGSQGHPGSARRSASACPWPPRTAAGIWCWRGPAPPWPWRRRTPRPPASAWRCRQDSGARPQVRTGISPDGDRESVMSCKS